MTTTFEQYKNSVKAKFEAEKRENFSGLLIDVTRKGLKEYCIFIASKRPLDKLIFNRIFEINENEDLARGIKRSDLDKLRPLQNFLSGKTKNPEPIVVELLAVLVDFKPRPYSVFSRENGGDSLKEKIYLFPESDFNKIDESVSGERESFQKQHAFDNLGLIFGRKKNQSTLWKTLVVFLAITISIGIFSKYSADPKCMVWVEDHYEPINCDERISFNATEFNKELMQKMSKISTSDTTKFFKNGKPIVWYCKHDNDIEFFTTHGLHPVSGVTLKPVTRYIVRKYVQQKP